MDEQQLFLHNKKLEAVSEDIISVQSEQRTLTENRAAFLSICEKRKTLMNQCHETWRTGEMNEFVQNIGVELKRREQTMLHTFEEEQELLVKKKRALEDEQMDLIQERMLLEEGKDQNEY